jgi:hypothetical protein
MLGATAGILIHEDDFVSGFRGALIGASVFPFMLYGGIYDFIIDVFAVGSSTEDGVADTFMAH